MKTLYILFKTEFILSVREFSGVLFGLIMPLGLMLLLGVLYGDRQAAGTEYTLLQQSFPAVITIGICATGLMGIPLTLAAYREKGILRRFRVTPVSPARILAAQFLNNFIFALSSGLLVWLAARLIFGYELRGSLLILMGAWLLVLTSLYALGMLIASVSGTIKTANLLCSLAYFPMLFLSGATIPFEIMPGGLQKVSLFMPLTQGILLLKGVSLGTGDFSWERPVIVLAVTGLISLVLSLKTFRWD